MKHYFIFMAIIFGMIAPSASAQNVKKKVAVYVTGDVESGYKKVIGSKLVTGITRSDDYSAVERTADFLAEMAKEQDYQLSGAVSDNQIARLGQQFGVRYVLVADISEVFESIFVSARMIDVQTAQITNSTEANEVVSNMDGLTKLSENIVLELLGTPTYSEDNVQSVLCSSFDDLYKKSMSGYHCASKEEIEDLMKNYQMKGKKVSFPIYANINYTMQTLTTPYTLHYHQNNRMEEIMLLHGYAIHTISFLYIEKPNKSSATTLSYTEDSNYPYQYQRENNSLGYTTGLYDHSTSKPNITAGYIYFIKNKDE